MFILQGTTETGGIKMIYNGNRKSVVTFETQTVMTQSNITATNDSTYPYSYDSETSKWTSSNHAHSSTGTFIFTVNVAGNYDITYSVSSERNYDTVKFYKSDVLLTEESGSKEEPLEHLHKQISACSFKT